MNQPTPVFPESRHALYEAHGYSAAIRSGDLLFVSGQVGSRADGTPEPDFAAQVQLAFDNLKATLAAAGCTFPTIMAIKNSVFPQPPYPNWTAVGVTWLAGFDFEIKVIARIPAKAE